MTWWKHSRFWKCLEILCIVWHRPGKLPKRQQREEPSCRQWYLSHAVTSCSSWPTLSECHWNPFWFELNYISYIRHRKKGVALECFIICLTGRICMFDSWTMVCAGGVLMGAPTNTHAAQAKAINGGEGEMSPKEEAAMPCDANHVGHGNGDAETPSPNHWRVFTWPAVTCRSRRTWRSPEKQKPKLPRFGKDALISSPWSCRANLKSALLDWIVALYCTVPHCILLCWIVL